MQTLRLRLQDLRAISLGQSPGRLPAPSMLIASTWKGAQPLPNHPSPTCAVGLRPERQSQNLDRCPTMGAGLFLVPPFRVASICGAVAPDLRRVCPRQTASELSPYPQPYGGRACGKKTVGRGSDGPGTYRSEAIGLRPTGRGATRPTPRMVDRLHLPFCAITPALVTGQEPGGTGVPGDALRWRLSSAREEGAWPATTSL